MTREKDLADEVAGKLDDAGLDYELDPSLGGLQPDFLVYGPQGQRVVIETKAWPSGGGHTARALEQVERYRRATKADHVFVVLEELGRNFKDRGVVDKDTLLEALQEFFEKTASRSRRGRKGRAARAAEQRTIFAAMPFAREYDDTYLVAMAYAAEQVGAACQRVDRTEFTGDVVEEVRRQIVASIAVIVDLSESKPNVLYEAGYAHALDKPAVHICSTSTDKLPFDVRNWNTLEYRRGQTAELRAPLARRLKHVLKGE